MNIFVAKLSGRTTGDDLRDLFEDFGTVTSAKVVMDKETGNSKRFGFVEMEDDQAAEQAIQELDGKEFDGSQIVVKVSEPSGDQRPRRRSNFRGNNQGGDDRRGQRFDNKRF
jgi:RNA recognition motif-containing protein